MLGGCSTMGPVVVSDYCQSYERILASRQDTAFTQRQILRENNKYRAVCGGK